MVVLALNLFIKQDSPMITEATFKANVNSHSRLLYVVVRLSVVCHLSVTFVHHNQVIKIFRNVSMPFGTLAIC